MTMRVLEYVVLATVGVASALPAQYASLTAYMMPRDAEIALARSAAPANVSDRATIKVLTNTGFQMAHEGDNGFVCLVLRGWAAPTFTPAPLRELVYYAKLRAPICYNPAASRTVLPYQELRTKLGIDGKTPDDIATAIQAAYATGKLPRMETVGFAYMFSADQDLGPGVGAFHPHVMVFAPYYDNTMLGGNAFGSALPFVSDDAGTPFAVTVIPVDHALAVRANR
jgi:hypothetical protein